MPQHKVQSGETLSGIASRYKVSPDAIQAENPIIKDANHIEAGWNLTVPESTAKQDAFPAAQSANDESRDEVECSDCTVECEALVHVTGEEQTVYALTRTQMKELYDEIDTLNEPLVELKEAEGGQKDEISAAREKAWGKLRELGALPKPEHSSTAEELLRDYEARWKRERARLEHQRRRQKRIEYEIDQIRNQILFPASQRNLTNRQDQLSVKVFATLCAELEATLPGVRNKVDAYQQVSAASKQDFTSMDKRLRYLRAALEAEIQCRLAESSDDADSHETRQLRHEADELKRYTLWPNFIAESDVQSLVEKHQRLRTLDDRLIPYMDYVSDYAEKVSWVVWLWNVINHEDVERHRKEQDERRNLIVNIEKTLNRLVEDSPPSAVDVLAKPNFGSMKTRPLVELKHTGGAGYRYARQDVLQQLRGNWKPLNTSDVRALMSAADFERAWGEARDSLRNNRSLKIKFAEWKSKEDNFFNQLEIELFKKEASTENGRFAASAEAQMFRFAAQCGLEGTYDPQKGEAYIGTQMQGAYSLLQGEAAFAARLPDETGARVILEYENHEGNQERLHCGYFRADAEYKIRGFAGACASLAAHAKVSTAPGEVGISGETNGEAFAGATLSNEATFGVKWKAEYQEVDGQRSENGRSSDADYRSLLEVRPEFSISTGIGAGFDYRVFLSGGKLHMTLKGRVVLGPGGGGGVAAELNAEQIWELVKFIRWSLEQSDFRFLEWIDRGAFEHLSFILRMFAVSRTSIFDTLERSVQELTDTWDELTTSDTKVRDAAERVLSQMDLKLLTPQAKGELLHLLSEDSAPTFGFSDPYREISAEACIELLETVSSHRELVEVLKRMGRGEQKGSVRDFMNNYYRLVPRLLFQSQQARRTEEWLDGILQPA